MNVLVVDVGGTHVKILATGKKEKREFASGPKLTAPQMVSRVRKLAQDWSYQVVSIGYPGPVLHNGLSPNLATLEAAGWDLTLRKSSSDRQELSTMQPCRRSAAIAVERCCSSG